EMALIGPIVRNDFFFPVTMLVLVALMVLLEYARRRPQAARAGVAGSVALSVALSRAEERKQQWTARRERLWAHLVVASGFVFILMVTAEFVYTRSVAALSPAATISFDKDGHAVVGVKDLPQGELRRYSADVKGVPVRFLLYRKPDGKVESVFDACQICG